MEPESRHLSAAHDVINKLNEKPGVQLDQIDGKDIIAQALADTEERIWGHLRDLARQVQRTVKRNDSDPAQEENVLLLMADDVLSGRLLDRRNSIAELIEKSSLGTPEAVAIRQQADPKAVARVLQASAQPGSHFGDTVTLIFHMTKGGVHARVEGHSSDYQLFEPTTRWKALERLGELMGWRSRSSTMAAQKTSKEQESINEVLHYADMLSSDLSGDAKKREGILYQLQQASRLLNSLRIKEQGAWREEPGTLLSVANPEREARSIRTTELIESCRTELGALRDADDGTDSTTRQVLGILVSAVSTLTAAVSNLVSQEKP